MSMILTMTTAAIIAGMTLSEFSIATIIATRDEKTTEEGLETIFVDSSILIKTLEELDCHLKVVSDDEIYVATSCGQLCYRRESAGNPFRLYLNEITDRQGLLENIRSFEEDYGRNIQDYTYHHIKENLSDNMRIENEYYEDDYLYITIDVD